MKLEIVTPEQLIFSGEVQSIRLPGTKGSFTILDHHAPLISSLSRGKLRFVTQNEEKSFIINGGFVEVSNKTINVCIEEILTENEATEK